MKTALKLGPADHNRRLTLEEYEGAEYQEGYRYEIIHGRLYVSPMPASTHETLRKWLEGQLDAYAADHPEVINGVYGPCKVFVEANEEVTAPEPDIGAYRGLPPLADRFFGINWRTMFPVLVVEILSPDGPEKDLVRNPPLYLSVPSIREYWVVEARPVPPQLSLVVHRRRGPRWQVTNIPPGDTYTTPLLPGFAFHLQIPTG